MVEETSAHSANSAARRLKGGLRMKRDAVEVEKRAADDILLEEDIPGRNQ